MARKLNLTPENNNNNIPEKRVTKRNPKQKSPKLRKDSSHDFIYLPEVEIKQVTEQIGRENMNIARYEIPFDKLKNGKICVKYIYNNQEVTKILDFTAKRDAYPKRNSLLDLL